MIGAGTALGLATSMSVSKNVARRSFRHVEVHRLRRQPADRRRCRRSRRSAWRPRCRGRWCTARRCRPPAAPRTPSRRVWRCRSRASCSCPRPSAPIGVMRPGVRARDAVGSALPHEGVAGGVDAEQRRPDRRAVNVVRVGRADNGATGRVERRVGAGHDTGVGMQPEVLSRVAHDPERSTTGLKSTPNADPVSAGVNGADPTCVAAPVAVSRRYNRLVLPSA